MKYPIQREEEELQVFERKASSLEEIGPKFELVRGIQSNETDTNITGEEMKFPAQIKSQCQDKVIIFLVSNSIVSMYISDTISMD